MVRTAARASTAPLQIPQGGYHDYPSHPQNHDDTVASGRPPESHVTNSPVHPGLNVGSRPPRTPAESATCWRSGFMPGSASTRWRNSNWRLTMAASRPFPGLERVVWRPFVRLWPECCHVPQPVGRSSAPGPAGTATRWIGRPSRCCSSGRRVSAQSGGRPAAEDRAAPVQPGRKGLATDSAYGAWRLALHGTVLEHGPGASAGADARLGGPVLRSGRDEGAMHSRDRNAGAARRPSRRAWPRGRVGRIGPASGASRDGTIQQLTA